ncbi:hypothetical protein AB0F43_28350 [Kribbella sp. NPDC023972]|uniref:hypothetical protein n=1 Tax=Kribbella sp. NPDC023972 TaxID=3154795 RepID=UPI0033EFFB1A
MSTQQPMPPGALTVINRLVGNVLDWQEKLPMRGANTTETFMVTGGVEPGAVDAEGNLYFDQGLVADPLERAMREGYVSDENRRAFQGALHIVTTTALIRRLEGPEAVHDTPFEDRAVREAYSRLNGARLVAMTTHGVVGPYPGGPASAAIDDAALGVDAPTQDPAARAAGLALVGNYANSTSQRVPDAAHELLKMPRAEIFDRVAEAALAKGLNSDHPVPEELRDRVARDLREGFHQVSQLPTGGNGARLEILKGVDATFAKVQETVVIAKDIMRHLSMRTATTESAITQDQGAAPAHRGTASKSTGKSGPGPASGR